MTTKPSAEKWWGWGSLISALVLFAALLFASGCASRVAEPLKQAKAEREAWTLLLDQLGYEQMDIWIAQSRRLPLGAFVEANGPTRAAVLCIVTKECEAGSGRLTVDEFSQLKQVLAP